MFIDHGGVYYLRAIVSSAILDKDQNCDLSNYAVFTDVLKYNEWIEDPTQTPSRDTRIDRMETSTETFKVILETSSMLSTSVEDFPEDSCGVMSQSTGMVQGGKLASSEHFPWLVVVSREAGIPGGTQQYQGGTLVSNQHIVTEITADLNENLSADQFKLFFGVSSIDHLQGEGVITSGVSKVILHPDNKVGVPREENLAILTADRSLSFSNVVRPICLWPQRDNSDDLEGKIAYGAGWGNDETGKPSKHKKFVKATAFAKCKGFKRPARVEFDKYFCAKSISGTPCGDDRQLYMKSNGTWYLRGMFAITFPSMLGICNPNYLIPYENMAHYTNWIQKQIESM